MVVNYKNTEINLKIERTDSNIGIKNDDSWCIIEFEAKNNEYHYKNKRTVMTYQEDLERRKKIKNFLKKPTKRVQKIRFIKNYFRLNLYLDDNKNKVLEFELVGDDKKSAYNIYFYNEEIVEFLKEIERSY